MANQATGPSPWSFDTPQAGAFFSGRIRILRLVYAGYSAATDSVEVQDANGHIIAFLQGTTALTPLGPVMIDVPMESAGLLIPVNQTRSGGVNLPNGALFVYFA